MDQNQIKIAIAGRPNVGKSTLFNRLTKSQKSITTPISGTTRDLIQGDCRINDIAVTLLDTGGITDSTDRMEKSVSRKAMSVLDEVDVILFMLDGKNVDAQDRELLEKFRKYTDKIILVINKIDAPEHDNLVWNFHSFGYRTICPVSASHARGIGELEDAIEKLLLTKGFDIDALKNKDMSNIQSEEEQNLKADDFDEDAVDLDNIDIVTQNLANTIVDDKKISISIMGKPNTGKSTLSNLLLGENRSIVSDIAGTTRDIVEGKFEYKGVDFTVCDTAGIRRKSKVVEDIEYFSVNRAIRNIRENDISLLVIDCTEGVSDQDKKIASLIVEKGSAVVLVLNKIDLLKTESQYNDIVDKLRFLFPQLSFAPVIGVSAIKHIGITKLLDTLIAVKRQLDVKIATSSLNKSLETWNQHYSAPRSGNTWYKILYAVQLSISPVRFLFIVNKKKGFPQSYISYIKNNIRKQFKMDKIPINVILRQRQRRD